jgi:hypothetical protein
LVDEVGAAARKGGDAGNSDDAGIPTAWLSELAAASSLASRAFASAVFGPVSSDGSGTIMLCGWSRLEKYPSVGLSSLLNDSPSKSSAEYRLSAYDISQLDYRTISI